MPAPVNEDIGFQRKMWVVERFGWTLLALVVVSAVMGAFGDGVLSEVRAGPADRSFEASYLRFARKQAPLTLRLEVRSAGRPGGSMTVWISSDYLERFTLNAISPEPDQAIAEANGTEYRFATGGDPDTVVVRFSLEPERAGDASGAIGVSEEASVPIRQFIFP